jgi:hypothetical protein
MHARRETAALNCALWGQAALSLQEEFLSFTPAQFTNCISISSHFSSAIIAQRLLRRSSCLLARFLFLFLSLPAGRCRPPPCSAPIGRNESKQMAHLLRHLF